MGNISPTESIRVRNVWMLSREYGGLAGAGGVKDVIAAIRRAFFGTVAQQQQAADADFGGYSKKMQALWALRWLVVVVPSAVTAVANDDDVLHLLFGIILLCSGEEDANGHGPGYSDISVQILEEAFNARTSAFDLSSVPDALKVIDHQIHRKGSAVDGGHGRSPIAALVIENDAMVSCEIKKERIQLIVVHARTTVE